MYWDFSEALILLKLRLIELLLRIWLSAMRHLRIVLTVPFLIVNVWHDHDLSEVCIKGLGKMNWVMSPRSILLQIAVVKLLLLGVTTTTTFMLLIDNINV